MERKGGGVAGRSCRSSKLHIAHDATIHLREKKKQHPCSFNFTYEWSEAGNGTQQACVVITEPRPVQKRISVVCRHWNIKPGHGRFSMDVALLLGDMTRADFSFSSCPERGEWSWLPLSFPTPLVELLPLGCRGEAAMFLHHRRGNSGCCRWMAERFFFALPKTYRKCHRSGRVGCLQWDQGHNVRAVKTPQSVWTCDK